MELEVCGVARDTRIDPIDKKHAEEDRVSHRCREGCSAHSFIRQGNKQINMGKKKKGKAPSDGQDRLQR